MGLGIGHIPVMGIAADAGRVKLVGSTLWWCWMLGPARHEYSSTEPISVRSASRTLLYGTRDSHKSTRVTVTVTSGS
jgi:hypothetical protein